MAGNLITWDIGLYNPDTYYIYRSSSEINPDAPSTLIATLGEGTNSYEDLDIQGDTTYYYYIVSEKMGLTLPGYQTMFFTNPNYLYVASGQTLRQFNLGGEEIKKEGQPFITESDTISAVSSDTFGNAIVGLNTGEIKNYRGEDAYLRNSNSTSLSGDSVASIDTAERNGETWVTAATYRGYAVHLRDNMTEFESSSSGEIVKYISSSSALSAKTGDNGSIRTIWRTTTDRYGVYIYIDYPRDFHAKRHDEVFVIRYSTSYEGRWYLEEYDDEDNRQFIEQLPHPARVTIGDYTSLYIGCDDGTIMNYDYYGNEQTTENWPFDNQSNGNPNGHDGPIRYIDMDVDFNIYTGQNNGTIKKIDPDGNHIWTINVEGGIGDMSISEMY